MITTIKKLTILSALLLISIVAMAQQGHAGVFLRMPVGWKQIAMGGCGVALGGEANSGWYNPAALQLYKGWGGTSGYSMLALDRWFYYVSAAGNLREDAAAALTWVHADAGDIDGRDISGNHTDMLDFGEDAIFMTFSKVIIREITIGANAKYVQARLAEITTYIAGFDFGGHVRLMDDRFLFGVAYHNLGMKYQWDSAGIYGSDSGTSSDETLAGYLRVGAAYIPKDIPGELTAEIAYADSDQLEYRLGVLLEPVEGAEIALGMDDGLLTAGGGYRFDAKFAKIGVGYSIRLEREGLPPRHTFDLIIGTE